MSNISAKIKLFIYSCFVTRNWHQFDDANMVINQCIITKNIVTKLQLTFCVFFLQLRLQIFSLID